MELFRDQGSTIVGVSSTLIVAGNMNRHALLISAPTPGVGQTVPTNFVANDADVSTLGIKLAHVVPANTREKVIFASAALVSGAAPTIQLQAIVSGSTIAIQTSAGNIISNPGITLAAGDTIQWNVTVVGAAGVMDFAIGVEGNVSDNRITLSFEGPAALDQGITLHAGNSPLLLVADEFGGALREEVTAIGSVANLTIGWVDIFCPCKNALDKKGKGGK